MTKFIIILLIGLVFEAIGVVCLSRGIKQIGDVKKVSVAEVTRVIRQGAANVNIGLGVFFEALFFGTLLILMSKADISFLWPLTSLSFVMTAIAAKFFLHEQISSARWTGVVLIMCGAALITWSEKNKEKEAHRAGVVQSAGPP